MADIEQQTQFDETEGDVNMGESGNAAASAGEEARLTELEPETPKLVLFAE